MNKKIIYGLLFIIGLFITTNVFADNGNIVLEDVQYNNTVIEDPVSCGNGLVTGIPPMAPKIINIVYIVIEIAVPILLVIFGSLDFIKPIIAQKEDEIKKNQQIFIKRLIAGALVFFVMVIVRFLISAVAENSKVIDCAECFIKNKCDK